MMLILINTIIITLFISSITAVSPINLGVIVLCIALSVSAKLALISTSWFSFITFIIYVGGMLVMFAYFAALQPNQHVINWSWILLPSFFISVMYIMWSSTPLMWTEVTPCTNQLYSHSNIILPIMMALILFLALIMVVKTSRAEEGPLRPFQ
uniref:NADH dehydrogenase subunit 6 n=1 Tax=Nectoneanthes oxypoda TaxID=1879264 RepID=UPI003002D737|nr:NADH dehydrogenase subunit 6 [Nectoneanthes oxypoda]